MVPIKNRDLWQRLDRALAFHRVQCRTAATEATPNATQPSDIQPSGGYDDRSDRRSPFAKLQRRRVPKADGWPIAARPIEANLESGHHVFPQSEGALVGDGTAGRALAHFLIARLGGFSFRGGFGRKQMTPLLALRAPIAVPARKLHPRRTKSTGEPHANLCGIG